MAAPKDSCRKFFKIFDSTFLMQKFPLILCICAILSGLSTYFVISKAGVSTSHRTSVVAPFIALDSIIIAFLIIVIINKVRSVYINQKKGIIGARLHITIIGISSLVTMMPSILMGILALTFFKSGFSLWFSQPVKNALSDANTVAELYLRESIKNIQVDVIYIVDKLKSIPIDYDVFSEFDREKIKKELDNLAKERGLEGIFVHCVNVHKNTTSFSSSLSIVPVQLELELELEFELELGLGLGLLDDEHIICRPEEGRGGIIVKEKNGAVQARIRIVSDIHDITMFLGVSKAIDSNILKYVKKAKDSTEYYNDSLKNQDRFQLTLIVLFTLSSVLLLLATIWMGITLADVLVTPLTMLISASEAVSKGDLSVRIKETSTLDEVNKLVLSFNRMTERLERQNRDIIISEKKSAWADIARKIAHEVKNPLTPIQLAAERLKRKYRLEIRSDPESFIKCTDTIIRQVAHIENLKNEFSAFARMPEAIFAPVDISQLVRDSIFLQKQVFPRIQFFINFHTASRVIWNCDGQQISQVLINLLQNAANSITESGLPIDGRILVCLEENESKLLLIIEDNGPGFPAEGRERLFEPYYTTREKGTGLGMAIVLRIITEHSGSLELKDAVGHTGARVEITLPKRDICT
jgi:two-component system nitrogen regulation sensor histidine kinase NtrY